MVLDCFAVRFVRLHARRGRTDHVGEGGGRFKNQVQQSRVTESEKEWRSICKQEVEHVVEECIRRMLAMEPPGRRLRGGLVTRYVELGKTWGDIYRMGETLICCAPPTPLALVMSSHSACLGCSWFNSFFIINTIFYSEPAHKHVYAQALVDVFCLGVLLLKAFVLLSVRKYCVYFYRRFWVNALARVFLLFVRALYRFCCECARRAIWVCRNDNGPRSGVSAIEVGIGYF